MAKGKDPSVRRGRGERRELPPEFEALARGERPPRRPRRPRLADPRAIALIPGVKNSDARMVFERRLAGLKDMEGDARLAELAQFVRLQLWRGGSIASLEAMLDNLLGLDPKQVLAELGESGFNTDPVTEEAAAMCIRAHAVLLQSGSPGAVRVEGENPNERLAFDLPANDAPEVLPLIARRIAAVAGRDVR